MYNVFEYGVSVGVASGLIAGFVSVLHTAFPLLYGLCIVAIIYQNDYSAATWSALDRLLQRCHLGDILNADGGLFGRSIAWHIRCVGLLSLVLTILILPLAGFITPTQLYTTLEPSQTVSMANFKYVPDTSLIGQGTPPRLSEPVKRVCDKANLFADCPGSTFNDSRIRNQYPGHVVVNSTMSSDTLGPYTSTAYESTISKPQDIEYRVWSEGRYEMVDNGAPRILGDPVPLTSLTSETGVRLIEGLIVDTTTGGICFRNHTMPVNLKLGARWEENLLCINPVSYCTRLNFVLHFLVSLENRGINNNGSLTDTGAISDARVSTPPDPSWNGTEWRDISSPPDLVSRTQNAAWWNNFFTASQLDPKEAPNYSSELADYAYLSSARAIQISQMNGAYLLSNDYVNATNTTLRNPTKSMTRNFTAYGVRATGYDDTDPSTAEKAYMRTGYLYGMPARVDTPDSQDRRDLGSPWSQYLHICSSTAVASVTTVTFESNGTETLESIKVVDMKKAFYSSGKPLRWGIERATGYNISGINLAWGLVGPDVKDSPTLRVVEADELYLPAMNRNQGYDELPDSFAAGTAFGAAWNSVYGSAAVVEGMSLGNVPSYSGQTSRAQAVRWRNLSTTAEGAATILNLIWTDLVASAVVSTTTGFPPIIAGHESDVLGQRAVYRFYYALRYANFLYAIPGFIVLGCLLVLLVIVLILGVLRRLPHARIVHYLNHVGAGRILSRYQHTTGLVLTASTGEWAKDTGSRYVEFPHPPAGGTSDRGQYEKMEQQGSETALRRDEAETFRSSTAIDRERPSASGSTDAFGTGEGSGTSYVPGSASADVGYRGARPYPASP